MISFWTISIKFVLTSRRKLRVLNWTKTVLTLLSYGARMEYPQPIEAMGRRTSAINPSRAPGPRPRFSRHSSRPDALTGITLPLLRSLRCGYRPAHRWPGESTHPAGHSHSHAAHATHAAGSVAEVRIVRSRLAHDLARGRGLARHLGEHGELGLGLDRPRAVGPSLG